MELGYIYFLQSLIWPENQSDEANEAKIMRNGDGWEANSRARRKMMRIGDGWEANSI